MHAKLIAVGAALMLFKGASAATAVVPAPQPPRPVSSAATDPATKSQQELLRKKLAQRDRLNREIDELAQSTRWARQIVINTEVLEVDQTRIRAAGFDFSKSASNGDDGLARFVAELKRQGFAKILADPTLVTVSGRSASFHVGGIIPMRAAAGAGAVKFQKYGTELDVLAVALGDNRVRLEIRQQVSDLDEEHAVVVDGERIPSIKSVQWDTALELKFGQTQALVGPVTRRSIATADSTVESKPAEVVTIVLVTVESADDAKLPVRQTSADAPSTRQ